MSTEDIEFSRLAVSDADLKKAIDRSIASTYPSMGNITISTANTGWTNPWSNSAPQYTIGSNGTSSGKVEIKGDEADLVINGKSLTKFMEAMESRLAILQPNLEKLEHFAALKKAYDHYKALEALCELPKKEDDTA